jgi:hypothetical protein
MSPDIGVSKVANLDRMDRDEIEAAIRSAFAGVRLGSGTSLRQAQVIDDYGRGVTEAAFEALPQSEVTDDWTRVPESELLRDNVAHLDAEGLRFYLPALMLWLLDHYDDPDLVRMPGLGPLMTPIGTVMALAPGSMTEEENRFRFEIFTEAQLAATAAYVEALPRLVALDQEDATRIARSIRDYWGQFLPRQ